VKSFVMYGRYIMSRIGNNPIPIPDKVELSVKGNEIHAKGPRGEHSLTIDPDLTINQDKDQIVIERKDDSKKSRQMHGISRSLVENMIIGVNEGYKKNLEIIGMGYKVEKLKRGILLGLGYSHQIYFYPPDGIELEADMPKRKVTADGTPNQLLSGTITVSGVDKQLVGQVAAKIRGLRKPDVYKSKGIRYSDERIHIKAGKTAV